MRYFLFFLTLISVQNLNSQPIQWVRHIAGVSDDQGYSIAFDNSNNIFCTGYFSGSVDFDPGDGVFDLTSEGGRDVFVVKLDNQGNFIWAVRVGNNVDDIGKSIAIDPSGNVFITGTFRGSVDFDPGNDEHYLTSSSVMAVDFFILKLDSSGNFLWAKKIGGSDADESFDIEVDADGNVYTTGYFTGTVDFDPGSGVHSLSSSGFFGMFLQKLDSTGNFLWAKSLGYGSASSGREIIMDDLNNFILLGQFINSSGNNESVLLKIDNSGNIIWEKQVGGDGESLFERFTLDESGNLYVTGEFKGTIDFDPGNSTSYLFSKENSYDIFIVKYDPQGNFLWAGQIGGDLDDSSPGITGFENEIYLSGQFQDVADVDPLEGTANLTTSGMTDIFIVKLDNMGNLLGREQIGGDQPQFNDDLISNELGEVIMLGSFQNYAEFNTDAGLVTFNAFGSNDVFISGINESSLIVGLPEKEIFSDIQIYPNPVDDIIKIKLKKNFINIEIRISDITGKTIYQEEFTNAELIEINCGKFNKGIYLLKAESEEEIGSYKIVKK